MLGFLLATVFYTANQGSAVQLKLPDEPHLKSVQVIWGKTKVPAFHIDDMWTTILGVDLDAKPGAHPAQAVLTMDDGHVDRREITVNVLAKKFPTAPLSVDERFVELSRADLSRAHRESKEADAIYRRITTDLVPDEPFTVPIPGGIGRNFGERRVFNGQPRAPHSGADLHAKAGKTVHATNLSRVLLAKQLFLTGTSVML